MPVAYKLTPVIDAGTVRALAVELKLAAPATAQWAVFDGANYAQNVLEAARALQQINNQIQSLQNEANMLMNMARTSNPSMSARSVPSFRT